MSDKVLCVKEEPGRRVVWRRGRGMHTSFIIGSARSCMFVFGVCHEWNMRLVFDEYILFFVRLSIRYLVDIMTQIT